MPHIKVGIRLKPVKLEEVSRNFKTFTGEQGSKIELDVSDKKYTFEFNQVFDAESDQEQIFNLVARPVIDDVMNGIHGTIFAFGQTGSGKTHTVVGSESGEISGKGLTYRSVEYLFRKLRGLDGILTSIQFSAMEIYNDTMSDLLRDPLQSESPKLFLADTVSGVVVPSLSLFPVSNENEAFNYLSDANLNRAVAEHQLNRRSSRSHCIYTYHLSRAPARVRKNLSDTNYLTGIVHNQEEDLDLEDTEMDNENSASSLTYARLHLVDLAGSERVHKTGSSGGVKKEAGHINRSLLYLEQVVMALGQEKTGHVPYRRCKLTHLLRDSLSGPCNTYMIACVWPSVAHVWETLSTLRFALRMKGIVGGAEPVRSKSTVGDGAQTAESMAMCRELQRELKSLRRELAMRDLLTGCLRGGPAGAGDPWLDQLTPSQRNAMVIKSAQFALLPPSGDVEEEVEEPRSLSQIRLVANVLRRCVWSACGQDPALVAAAVADVTGYATTPLESVTSTQALLDQGGSTTETAAENIEKGGEAVSAADGKKVEVAGKGEDRDRDSGRDRFAEFIAGPGRDLHAVYELAYPPRPSVYFPRKPLLSRVLCQSVREDIRANKTRQKELVYAVNESKASIDQCSDTLARLQSQSRCERVGDEGENESEVGDQDLETAVSQTRRALEEQKKRYKALYGELKAARATAASLEEKKRTALSAVMAALQDSDGANGVT